LYKLTFIILRSVAGTVVYKVFDKFRSLNKTGFGNWLLKRKHNRDKLLMRPDVTYVQEDDTL